MRQYIKNPIELCIFGFTLLCFNVLLSKYSFPLTEGWWETYSWLSRTQELYSDVTLSFPPLFILLQGLFLRITENFFVLRLIFCFLALIEFILMLKLLEILGYKKYAIQGAFFANVLIIIQNPVWIVKDYHLIVTILELIFLISFTSLNTGIKKNINLNILFLGVILGLFLLLKQNIAVLLIISLLLLDVLHYSNKRFANTKIVITSVFFTLFFSLFYGFDWWQVYIGNDSKGNISRIFLRIFEEKELRVILFNSLLLFLISLLFYIPYNNAIKYSLFLKLIEKKYIEAKGYFEGSNYLTPFIFFFFTWFCFFSNGKLLFIITIAFILLQITFKLKKYALNVQDLGTYVLILTIIYTGTMTAGFNYVSMQIPIAILICSLLSRFLDNISKSIKIILSCILIATSIYGFYKNKFISESYNWWGYSLSPINDSYYSSDIIKLNGIKFDKNTHDILTATSKYMVDKNNTLFSFPSIPIFYYLYDRKPLVSSPVLWFDVFPSKYLDGTLKTLKDNNPDYVFWLKPTHYSYEGHAKLKNNKIPLIDIDNYLNNLIKVGKYEIVYIKPIVSGNDSIGNLIYKKNITNTINASFICNFCDNLFMKKIILNNEIVSYTSNADQGFISITFMNNYSLANFIENYKISPLRSNLPIFYILKKVN